MLARLAKKLVNRGDITLSTQAFILKTSKSVFLKFSERDITSSSDDENNKLRGLEGSRRELCIIDRLIY